MNNHYLSKDKTIVIDVYCNIFYMFIEGEVSLDILQETYNGIEEMLVSLNTLYENWGTLCFYNSEVIMDSNCISFLIDKMINLNFSNRKAIAIVYPPKHNKRKENIVGLASLIPENVVWKDFITIPQAIMWLDEILINE